MQLHRNGTDVNTLAINMIVPCNAISVLDLTVRFFISKQCKLINMCYFSPQQDFWTVMQWFTTQCVDPNFSLEYFMICFPIEVISSHLETEPRHTLWHWFVSGAY